MSVVFFSYSESDRETVLMIKGRALNPFYSQLSFRVQDLLARWNTNNPAVIRQAISKSLAGTSRTIVFVGQRTHASQWVEEEVEMTLAARKPVRAIALGHYAPTPTFLMLLGITVHPWSEGTLQRLATQ